MELKTLIDQDIKTAMREQNKVKLNALRSIKSAIILAETAEGRPQGTPLSEEEGLKVLNKLAKQRRDSIKQFRDAGREDLATVEEAELEFLNVYLPQPFTEAELEAALREIIAEVGATGPKDMGKVMGAAKRLAGKADGQTISAKAKALLG